MTPYFGEFPSDCRGNFDHQATSEFDVSSWLATHKKAAHRALTASPGVGNVVRDLTS